MDSRVGVAVSTGGRKTPEKQPRSSNQPKHSTPIKEFVKPIITPGHRSKSKSSSSRSKCLHFADSTLKSSFDHNKVFSSSSREDSQWMAYEATSMKKPKKPSCDSPLSMAKVTEFENNTISKQRQELHLLVAELKDRDRELNEMVATHQRQMASWEKDRQKIANLEDNMDRMQNELQSRNHDYRGLVAKLRTAESEEINKSAALNNTQEQLAAVTEQHSHTSTQLLELEGTNKSLNNSIRDLSTSVGKLEAREEELITVLKLKDRDLSETSSHIAELNVKLKTLDANLQDSRDAEMSMKRKASAWKNKYEEAVREIDRYKREILKYETGADEYKLDIHKLKQDLAATKKEVVLATEREKRKDQLLVLQKSKQERTDTELSNLRVLYERQQMDLSLLHSNLESTKELLKKATQNRSLESSYADPIPSYTSSHRSHRTLSPPRHIPYTSTSPGSILRRNRSKSPGTSAANVYTDHYSHRSTSPGNPASSISPDRISRSKSPRSYIDRTRSRSPSLDDYHVPQSHSREYSSVATDSRSSRYDTHRTRSPYSSYTSSYRYYASNAFDHSDIRRGAFDEEKKSEKDENPDDKKEKEEIDDILEINGVEGDRTSLASSGRGTCSNVEESKPAEEQNGEEILENGAEKEPSEIDDLFEAQDLVRKSTPEVSEQKSSATEEVEEDFDVSLELASSNSAKNGEDEAISARETDSPATKLHKLLVESCDMVQDLEQSATSSVRDAEEESEQPERDELNNEEHPDINVTEISDTDC